ncbi:uncharacterized protein LAJ45_08867 [Morchella importuna]|uniref:uncharacterized protein n=1 Tax=Morchella importuna TaxID=1174673 RepID=UPI001E8EDCF7|nr:uncharacterized protein LAJ45_08867 [Morchella importuna]KAH8147068.1 hypothetical protein LAJ45_08867 [Morchella importuna]
MAVTEGTLRAGGEPAKATGEENDPHTCNLTPIGAAPEDTQFFYLDDDERITAWVPLAASDLIGRSCLPEVSFAVLTHSVVLFMSQSREILLDSSKQDVCRPMVYRFARQIIPVVWGNYLQDQNFNQQERFAHAYQIVRELIGICLELDVEDIPTETRRVSSACEWSETPRGDELQTSWGDSPENLTMLEHNFHNARLLGPNVLIYRSDSTIALSRLSKGIMGKKLERALLSTLTDLGSVYCTMLENIHAKRGLASKENFEPEEMISSTPLLGLKVGGIRHPAYVNPNKVMLRDCTMPVMPHEKDEKDYQDFCSSGLQSTSRDALVTAMKKVKLSPDSAGPRGIQKRRYVPKARSPLQKMELACENACQYDSDFDKFVNHENPPINTSPDCIWCFD